MLETTATVIENRAFGAGYCHLEIEVNSPLTVGPGQFAMLKPAGIIEPLLRRAMAFYRVKNSNGTCRAEFIYRVLGRGTQALSQLVAGQTVEFLGPLGKCFSLAEARQAGQAIIVAGGVGTPAVLILAEALKAAAIPTWIFLGARAQADLIGVEDFARLDQPLTITTDDGSYGRRGFVTVELEKFLAAASDKNYVVYTCGPEIMMEKTTEIAARYGVRTFASLEARMACGFGVCVGCVVEIALGEGESNYQRVCVEGPVFEGSEVLW